MHGADKHVSTGQESQNKMDGGNDSRDTEEFSERREIKEKKNAWRRDIAGKIKKTIYSTQKTASLVSRSI